MKVCYSIISRGSEKYINHGYMGVSEQINNKQYLLDVDHNTKFVTETKHSMSFKPKYSIQNIAISRFELISEITFDRIKINDNILICGFGNIGFTCLLNLLKRGYKKIKIFSNIKYDINVLERKYKVKIQFIKQITDEFKTYIDATGSSNVLESIFEEITYLKDIIIISTPREETFKIDPLIINRKNISIYGGHELNGIDKIEREKKYRRLLKKNKSIERILNDFVSIHKFSTSKLNRLLMKKNNIIDIFQY